MNPMVSIERKRRSSTRRGGSVKVFSIDLHTTPFPSYCVLYTPCPSLFIQRIFYYVRDARGGKEIGCFINRASPPLLFFQSIFHAQRSRNSWNFFQDVRFERKMEYWKGKGRENPKITVGPHAITNLHGEGNV